MIGLLKKFLKNYKTFFQIIKKDIVYIVLLFFIILVFGSSYYHSRIAGEKNPPSLPEQKTEEIRDLIKSGEVTKELKITGFVILFATMAGIFMVVGALRRILIKRRQALSGFTDILKGSETTNLQTPFEQSDIAGQAIAQEPFLWNLWDVVKIVIIFFTAYIFFNFLHELIIAVFNIPEDNINTGFLLIIDMLFAEVVAVFFLLKIVCFKYDTAIGKFGLNTVNFGYNLYLGIKSYVMFLPFYFLLNFITLLISKAFSIELKPQEVLYMLSDKSEFTAGQLQMVIFFVSVLGPVFEEIFFRGFLYRCLRRYIGVFWGILGSALLFSLIHHNFMAFLPIVTLGIVLGYLVEKTGSLVPSIVMHIIVNSISVAVLFSMPKP